MLLVSAIIMSVVLIYAIIWEPLTLKQQQLQQSLAKQEALFQWMQQSSLQVQQLRSTHQLSDKSGKSLTTLADTLAKKHDVRRYINRISPNGRKGVRIRIENAPFNKLLSWFSQLEQQGLTLQELNITPKSAGLVNAQLQLAKPGL
jgi:type II secretory pathway component PulM